MFDSERGVGQAPLNTRGWVMQERLLSRRILHFGSDMIYWECCIRSASELRPHGYIYNKFTDDFEDNYFPNLGETVSTRGKQRAADRKGRGISWAGDQAVRPRPPPVMIDPDYPVGSQIIWRRKRGFWRIVLKPDDRLWSDDENGGNDVYVRGEFRAAFEKLRSVSTLRADMKKEHVG
jgi:hypothetical protein